MNQIGGKARQPGILDGVVRGTRARRLGLAALVLASVSLGFGAPDLAEQQLEHSKRLYAEAEEAMEAERYADAVAKFQEGYRYAPELHIFALNIATAADAMGDCQTARTWLRRFVDLVPKHPQRKASVARLEVLDAQCQVTAETAEVARAEAEAPTSSARKSRDEIEAERAFNDAIGELLTAHAQYTAAAKRHASTRPLARAARRKKANAKRMRKLADSHDVTLVTPVTKPPEVAATAAEACRLGRAQENRVAGSLQGVLKWYDADEIHRVVGRILRLSERRDRPAFEECT